MCFYNFPGRIVPWSNYRCEPCWHCQVCTLHLWSRGQMRVSMVCTIRLSSSHKIGLKADQTLSGEEQRQAKSGHILSSRRAYTCYIHTVLQVLGITYYYSSALVRCWMKNISGIELHLGILWKFCSMPMEFWIQGLGNFSWVQSKQTKGNSSYCRALEIEWKKSLPLGCCKLCICQYLRCSMWWW